MADNKINTTFTEWNSDIDIDEDTVEADRGAVAVGDDIDESAVNTGRFSGIQNADGDVDADGATIGDGNITLTGSDVGAMSFGRGDATNVEADNANLGRGDLNDIDAENANVGRGTLIDVDSQGDGQTIVGSGNEVTGDVDVDMDDVSGNANLAIGDHNEQTAVQDNDTSIDQSYTDNSTHSYVEDNSVSDSFNTEYHDSFNTETELTSTYEDNDVFEDNDSYVDASSYESTETDVDTDVDLHHVEDTDLDLDVDA